MEPLLSNQEQELLKALLSHSEPVACAALARQLGISERTTRSRVHALNNRLDAPCIQAGRRGYTCDRDAARRLLASCTELAPAPDDVPQTAADRRNYIISHLLRSSRPINLYDLCEELYVSLSTLNGDLARIRRKLMQFDLALVTEDGALSVTGSEKSKRRVLSELLYNETSVNFLDLDTVQRVFPEVDTVLVKKCITSTLDENRYFVNDLSLINLVLHIVIAIERIRSGGEAAFGEGVDTTWVRPHELAMASDIADALERAFSVRIAQDERVGFALLLASRTAVAGYEDETRESIERYVDAATLKLVGKLVLDVESYYYINLSEKESFIRFALHIKNLLARGRTGAFAHNPFTDEIRSNCPLLYDAAVSEAGIIYAETGIRINDDEIAYIAMHLGSTIEMQKQLASKVRTALYCPSYYNLAQSVRAFVDDRLSDEIIITAVVANEDELAELSGIELVIATAPVNRMPAVPVYRIGVIPRESDAARIREIVAGVERERRQRSFRTLLEELVVPSQFMADTDISSKDEAIHVLASSLVKDGYAYENYEEEIRAREQLSPTVFGTVAVPHTLKPHSKHSCIAVLVPRESIDWGTGVRVNLVLMLSFSIRRRATFNELFDPLIQILVDEQRVSRLAGITNYQEFIDALCDMLE